MKLTLIGGNKTLDSSTLISMSCPRLSPKATHRFPNADIRRFYVSTLRGKATLLVQMRHNTFSRPAIRLVLVTVRPPARQPYFQSCVSVCHSLCTGRGYLYRPYPPLYKPLILGHVQPCSLGSHCRSTWPQHHGVTRIFTFNIVSLKDDSFCSFHHVLRPRCHFHGATY